MNERLRRFLITSFGILTVASVGYFGLKEIARVNRENAGIETYVQNAVFRENNNGEYNLFDNPQQVNYDRRCSEC